MAAGAGEIGSGEAEIEDGVELAQTGATIDAWVSSASHRSLGTSTAVSEPLPKQLGTGTGSEAWVSPGEKNERKKII